MKTFFSQKTYLVLLQVQMCKIKKPHQKFTSFLKWDANANLTKGRNLSTTQILELHMSCTQRNTPKHDWSNPNLFTVSYSFWASGCNLTLISSNFLHKKEPWYEAIVGVSWIAEPWSTESLSPCTHFLAIDKCKSTGSFLWFPMYIVLTQNHFLLCAESSKPFSPFCLTTSESELRSTTYNIFILPSFPV